MKPAAVACVVGATVSVIACLAGATNYTRLGGVIEAIESVRPAEEDKVALAIATLLPANEKAEPAIRLIRGRLDEVRTLHSAWLEMAKSMQRSARWQSMMALGSGVMFFGAFILLRADEQKRKL